MKKIQNKENKNEDSPTKKIDKITYEILWKSIIRPERDIYTEKELGEKIFRFNNIIYTRTDYDILDFQGNILKLSIVEPKPEYRPFDIMPYVIYLHENCGSRAQAMSNSMKICLLKHNINLVSFSIKQRSFTFIIIFRFTLFVINIQFSVPEKTSI